MSGWVEYRPVIAVRVETESEIMRKEFFGEGGAAVMYSKQW